MFFFLLSPNNSGSTIIAQYLAEILRAYLPPFGNNEGQAIPEVQELISTNSFEWKPESNIPWQEVKSIWEQKLNESGKRVFLEKSPPNVLRAAQIKSQFFPKKDFVGCCSISHPLNLIASCVKSYTRPGSNVSGEITKWCQHWIYSAELQRKNILEYGLPWFSYEQFCSNPYDVCSKVIKENGLDINIKESEVHVSGKWTSGYLSKITDLSARHISFLNLPEVELIYKELAPKTEILEFFNYDLLSLEELNVKLMENSFLTSQGIKERNSFDSRMKKLPEPTKKELLKSLLKKL